VSTRLRDLLDDLATDARDYGDGDRAVATARRRVTARRIAVPAVAAATVAALILAVGVVRGSLRLDVGPPGGPSNATGPVPGYPARITEPADPQPLPHAPGGLAAFLWSPCDYSCRPYLVMTDGRQFALPRSPAGTPTEAYTLSPDGGWLGRPMDDGYELLRLADGRVLSIPDEEGWGELDPWAWSPNSEWFLLGRNNAGDVDHFVLTNLRDGSAPRRVAPPPDGVVAMNNAGDLIGWIQPDDRRGALPELTIVRNGESTVDRRIAVRLPPNATDMFRDNGEAIRPFRLRLGPDDRSGLLIVDHPETLGDLTRYPAAVLHVDLSTGLVTGRIDLPEAGDGTTGRAWNVDATLPGGALIVHWPAGRTELVVLNTVTGELVVATTLPPDADIAVRAEVW
jgi:hypothetical protein